MTTTADPPPARTRAPAAPAKRPPKRERQGAAWVFLSPWVLGASVLTLLPMAVSLYLSFTDYDLFNRPAGWACATTRRCSPRTPATGGRSARP